MWRRKYLRQIKELREQKRNIYYLCPTGAEFRFGIINHNFMTPRWLGTCAEFHAALRRNMGELGSCQI
jgi:hypothetical protein